MNYMLIYTIIAKNYQQPSINKQIPEDLKQKLEFEQLHDLNNDIVLDKEL